MNDQEQAAKRRWEALARAEMSTSSGDSERLLRRTREGIEVPLLCTEEQLPGAEDRASRPGLFPFTRGPYASMYAGRSWTVRQYAGFSTAAESNAFYRQALSQGQRGLSVAFDLPTHRGYDSDDPRVAGDVGKAGVAIDSVEDMRRLFEAIPLDKVSVSMTMSGAVLPVLAAFLVAAEEQGIPRHELQGTIQNDILKEFMVRNTYIYPPAPSMQIVADVISYCSKYLPRFNPISISGYHIHEAGASADLELGLTLANGLEYVRAACERGLRVDDFAPRLSFFFGVGMNFFMEVAKLRAARLLWASLMRERFAPSDEASCRLRMHCQTSGVSLVAQQPLNNIVRTTQEALAAILGGTQSLHTNSYDEALALPSDAAAAIARNTQLILQHESALTDVIDPLAGSYLVEFLTRQLAAKGRELVAEVEARGGMISAVAEGWPQRRIEASAIERQVAIERGMERVVGVNAFVSEEAAPEVRSIDATRVLTEQCAGLRALKAGRDSQAVQQALGALRLGALAAQAGQPDRANLLELAVHAMRVRATVGEVSMALEQVFTRHQASTLGVRHVFAASYQQDPKWQALLARVRAFETREGRRPRLLVVKLGQDGHDRGAKVIASAFADVGFDVDLAPLFQTPAEAARQAVDSDVHVVGVSTLAGAHTQLVPELLRELAGLGAQDTVVVCGGIVPSEDAQALRAAGVRAVFGPGSSVVESAATVLDLIEAGAEKA